MTTFVYLDITGTLRTPSGGERRYRIGDECGDIFEIDDDFDGLTLTIEVTSLEEAQGMLALLQEGI